MKRQPIFQNVPDIVFWVFGVIILFSITDLFAGFEIKTSLMNYFALMNKTAYSQVGNRPFLGGLSLFGHVLLHANLGHLFMNVMFGFVLSVPIARALGNRLKGKLYFIVFFLLSAVGGAIAFFLLEEKSYPVIAIGASSSVSGLFAGLAYLIGGWRNVLIWSVAILVVNLIGIAIAGMNGSSIAWSAHLGGYISGAVLIFLYKKFYILE